MPVAGPTVPPVGADRAARLIATHFMQPIIQMNRGSEGPGGAEEAARRADEHARCMRAHDIPHMLDPTTLGELNPWATCRA